MVPSINFSRFPTRRLSTSSSSSSDSTSSSSLPSSFFSPPASPIRRSSDVAENRRLRVVLSRLTREELLQHGVVSDRTRAVAAERRLVVVVDRLPAHHLHDVVERRRQSPFTTPITPPPSDSPRLVVVLERTANTSLRPQPDTSTPPPRPQPPVIEAAAAVAVNVPAHPLPARAIPPAAGPQPVPPPPPRRRHAVVPRRVTYRMACDADARLLERTCGAPFSCGTFTDVCRFCRALFFVGEPRNRAGNRLSCCKGGLVTAPALGHPLELRRLYQGDSPESRTFLGHVRCLNSLFAMATFKSSTPEARGGGAGVAEGQGHWCFTVCGQVYHHTMGLPDRHDLQRPRLSHYYFVDAADAVNHRAEFLEGRVPRETVEYVEGVLRRHNRYVRSYMSVGETIREIRRRRGRDAVDRLVVGFARQGNMNALLARHGLPESNDEIAAVFDNVDRPPFPTDLVLYPRVAIQQRAVDDDNIEEENRDDVDQVMRHHELKNLNPMADPLVYPLLFPLGEDGYDMNLRHNNRKVTMREFYRYRIQCRAEEEFSLLHHAGKLFQQYLVDAWIRVEADYLWFLRQRQNRFRLARDAIIRRVLANRAPGDVRRVGRVVVLPAAFHGGPRNIRRRYLDAMTVIARHGKPDLFVTFTCNPRWPEISGNLARGEKFEHRPELVCRVFKVKFDEFMDDVVNKQLYGIVQNYHYVIEFQKRGLPHAHLLVTLIAQNKIRTPEDVDAIVCATIPDPVTRPRLHRLVGDFQVHPPCGEDNPRAPCMTEEGVCKSRYPQRYIERTSLRADDPNQPPVYRRPADGRTVIANGRRVTNERIVPYNPYALAKFHTHVNFEYAGSLASMKYLFKYLTKGPEFASLVGQQQRQDDPERGGAGGEEGGNVRINSQGSAINVDEIKAYLDGRYVNSMEAAWKLLEFKMYDRSHAVMVLPVHLPDQHYVVVDEDEDYEELEDRLEARRRTKLMAWFALNDTDPRAGRLHYVDVPEHYTWNTRDFSWRRRAQVAKMIGCMPDVRPLRPEDMELFYLRTLLRHVPGATSYLYLRTVNGVAHDTFRGACEARGLLDDIREYERVMEEAVLLRHPANLRDLFALLVCVLPGERLGQVPALWNRFRRDMSEDYLERGEAADWREALSLCVHRVDAILRRNRADLTCAAVGVAVPEEAEEDDAAGDRAAATVAAAAAPPASLPPPDIARDAEQGERRFVVSALTGQQKRVAFKVLRAVAASLGNRPMALNFYDDIGFDVVRDEVAREDARQRVFYVDGPGGSGKTFLLNAIIRGVHEHLGESTIAVAWTGIAANLLIGGRTCHRAFRLPVHLADDSVVGWDLETPDSDRVRRAALVVWDEAPMSHRYAVEAVDRYLRDVTGNRHAPMGGKCLIFAGDFRQVLPVIPGSHRAVVTDACITRSDLWRTVVPLGLTTNLRVSLGGRRREDAAVPSPPATRDDDDDDALDNDGSDDGLPAPFADWLLALGDGTLPQYRFDATYYDDLVEIPRPLQSASLEELLGFAYGVRGSGDGEPDPIAAASAVDRAILCPTNAVVNEINGSVLESLPGPERVYASIDRLKGEPQDEFRVPMDVLNAVDVAGLPPHQLRLKVGAVVVLLRNLDVDEGQCNGTRLEVLELGQRLLRCRMLTGVRRGREAWLPRINLFARVDGLPQQICRFQFPVRLAFAMTINKAQGQTFARVGVYLKGPCFAHGQLYVACSRVRRASDLSIYIENGLHQGCFRYRNGRKFTRNVVLRPVLDRFLHQQPADDDDDRTTAADAQTPSWELVEMGDDEALEPSVRDQESGHEPMEVDDEPVSEEASRRPVGPTRFDFVPWMCSEELAARVSKFDEPGTSGLGRLRGADRPSPSRLHGADNYDDDDDYSD